MALCVCVCVCVCMHACMCTLRCYCFLLILQEAQILAQQLVNEVDHLQVSSDLLEGLSTNLE